MINLSGHHVPRVLESSRGYVDVPGKRRLEVSAGRRGRLMHCGTGNAELGIPGRVAQGMDRRCAVLHVGSRCLVRFLDVRVDIGAPGEHNGLRLDGRWRSRIVLFLAIRNMRDRRAILWATSPEITI